MKISFTCPAPAGSASSACYWFSRFPVCVLPSPFSLPAGSASSVLARLWCGAIAFPVLRFPPSLVPRPFYHSPLSIKNSVRLRARLRARKNYALCSLRFAFSGLRSPFFRSPLLKVHFRKNVFFRNHQIFKR